MCGCGGSGRCGPGRQRCRGDSSDGFARLYSPPRLLHAKNVPRKQEACTALRAGQAPAPLSTPRDGCSHVGALRRQQCSGDSSGRPAGVLQRQASVAGNPKCQDAEPCAHLHVHVHHPLQGRKAGSEDAAHEGLRCWKARRVSPACSHVEYDSASSLPAPNRPAYPAVQVSETARCLIRYSPPAAIPPVRAHTGVRGLLPTPLRSCRPCSPQTEAVCAAHTRGWQKLGRPPPPLLGAHPKSRSPAPPPVLSSST